MRSTMKILGLAGLLALAIGAQARAVEQATPAADEIRLTIRMGERGFGFVAKQDPLARRTLAFEGSDHAPTDEMRAAVAEIAPLLQAAKSDSAFVVTAYASDPLVAYRRARAVRGELIERHQIAAGRLIAAGRAAAGHVGGPTIVDLHEIDPANCSGCGATPFRTIAYDSGTTRLVTMLPERLAAAGAASPAAAPAKPAAAARPAAPRIEPARPLPRTEPDQRAVRSPGPAAVGGCPRPRIIIDDYYPGGPLVPCRSTRANGRG